MEILYAIIEHFNGEVKGGNVKSTGRKGKKSPRKGAFFQAGWAAVSRSRRNSSVRHHRPARPTRA